MSSTPRSKRLQLALLAAIQLLAMGVWFSASAVLPQLQAEWGLSVGQRGWMTSSVQLGFVAGALASAVLGLADRFRAERLCAVSAAAAAVATAAVALVASSPLVAIVLRAATGVALAGVYPPGMKLVASWCREDRGLGIGILVGALTAGSAGPHLLNALLGADGFPAWRQVLLAAAALALIGGLLALAFARSGPHLPATARFDTRYAWRSFQERPARLANLGYLGHMWELYAMWAWLPILLLASYEAAGWSPRAGRLAGFGVVAIGAVGAVVAGALADRLGRTTVTIASLAVSGSCAVAAGALLHRPGPLTALCLLWGLAVVADSAQFSTAVSELSDPRAVGTALTVQTCTGFLLTLVTLQLLPLAAGRFGWAAVLPLLSLGPLGGILAMARLRRLPEAARMAGGNR